MRAVPSSIRAVEWLCELTGHAPTAGAKGVMVLDAKGRIRGAVVFDRWTENACEAHMAVETPAAWRVLAPAAFHYVFKQAMRGVCFAPIRSDNLKALRTAQHLGFSLEHRIAGVYNGGVDMCLLRLNADEMRWSPNERRAA